MFEYVCQHYGVPACLGREVTAYGKAGIIVKDLGHHIGVTPAKVLAVSSALGVMLGFGFSICFYRHGEDPEQGTVSGVSLPDGAM
ncbi:hypothetical protein [Serratia fonticola]|uniref:hypothetical protein n=1 Tax=Serratia fonticola TaxID=47917 RepID=UPI00192A4F04|nr:hypothetical protein [Serratia fonticola]NCG54470.1 hypothetical protein [Serratia fonticola]